MEEAEKLCLKTERVEKERPEFERIEKILLDKEAVKMRIKEGAEKIRLEEEAEKTRIEEEAEKMRFNEIERLEKERVEIERLENERVRLEKKRALTERFQDMNVRVSTPNSRNNSVPIIPPKVIDPKTPDSARDENIFKEINPINLQLLREYPRRLKIVFRPIVEYETPRFGM